MANINPQTQSLFMTALPREIRDLIYLAIWQLPNHGLRQHIIRHKNDHREQIEVESRLSLSRSQQAQLELEWHPHFCRWPCSRDGFDVGDPLQEDIEKERVRLGHGLSGAFQNAVFERRMQSPWFDHWACGEEAARVHGIKAIGGVATSGGGCWRAGTPSGERTSWLPMLLVCKAISAEVLKSIYESTTFILTDTLTIQLILGFCHMPPLIRAWPASKLRIPPPGLFRYSTMLEISLSAAFSSQFYCSDRSEPRLAPDGHDAEPNPLHNPYNFHWLRLGQFDNLRSLKIWVAARGQCLPNECQFVATPDLTTGAVRSILENLGSSKVVSVLVSMPLAEDIGPAEDGYVDGYVEGVSPRRGVQLWKRGSGDRFHPFLAPISNLSRTDGVIYISAWREVNVSRMYGDDMVVSPRRG